jgi:hypothetical protein
VVESSRYPVPGLTKTPYTLWPPAITGSAVAFAPTSAPPAPPAGPIVRLLCCGDWSNISVMVHVVPAQNESCAAALA